VCPSVADVVFEEFPDLQVLSDVISSGLGAAQSVGASQLTKDPNALSNEARNAFSDLATKAQQTAERVAEELKDAAEQIATEAKQAVIDEMDKVQQVIEGIEQNIIDVGTDLQNLDQIALNAMAAEFPGFKDAIECLKGGPEGSSNREASGDGAKEQINTPVPPNPAKVKSDVSTITTPPTVEEVQRQQGRELTPREQALRDIKGLFENEYPTVLIDPNDENTVYAVYPGIGFVDRFDISNGRVRPRGGADFDEVNAKYQFVNLYDLPVQKQRVDDEGEDAEDAVTELPE
jgi:hypothetical protein